MSSSSVFPDENLLLYLNITGELFYIVVHRMECQGIETQLQVTVATQLILGICSPEVVNEVAEGRLRLCDQPFETMNNMVKELVDSTIMKINEYSMEKLFELTLIATKYQYTVAAHPKDLLLIALNHLDGIRKFAKETRAVALTESLHTLLVNSYAPRSTSQMESYRWAILHYVEDVKLKMTNLVNLGLQDDHGDFIQQDSAVVVYPGDGHQGEDGEVKGSPVVTRCMLHSLELNGNRVITLGRSIYDQKIPDDSKFQQKGLPESSEVMTDEFRDGVKAIQGLEFCSTLLGGDSSVSVQPQKRQGFGMGHAGGGGVKLSRADSTQTIRIDARLDRSDTKCPLDEIVKQFEDSSAAVGQTAASPLQASRDTLCKLMESMLNDEL